MGATLHRYATGWEGLSIWWTFIRIASSATWKW